VYYTNVIIVLNYIYKEFILPLNLALKSLYSFKDYSFIFTYKRKAIDLLIIFVFDRQEIFATVISLLKYKQVLSNTPEWP
jgi:hypothetical protein